MCCPGSAFPLLQENFRYDFIVRQRPDTILQVPMPSVFSLKRAVYADVLPHGVMDMWFLGHRDFAWGMLGGGLSVIALGEPFVSKNGGVLQWSAPLWKAFSAFSMNPGPAMCSRVSCECTLKVALLVCNAVLVPGAKGLHGRGDPQVIVRLPNAETQP